MPQEWPGEVNQSNRYMSKVEEREKGREKVAKVLVMLLKVVEEKKKSNG